ncbi:roadblock/LC7 domain-containing protein [Streptomyces sp. NBC_01264]|uniref:roadblock/LC7 domain-containing protein n=1 Tax=Streptomyces sp. NBC_01264 TaxID=2903804 RepID=UPI00225AAC59|nr:roadblock/LC7 domain-containing protein [Streptomyces sp. NBC_01264]MCX4781755.1 roadblock/LC7 domain-containing protein [Streptomyces sp. NBC_01264]
MSPVTQPASAAPALPTSEGLDWIVNRFTERVVGIRAAAVVSADGLLLASSAGLVGDATRLAAVSSGLVALSAGGAQLLDRGGVSRTIIEMAHGTIVVMAISDGSLLAVLASPQCDLGVAGYHMARLARQCGDVLTPARRGQGPDGPAGNTTPPRPWTAA